MRAGDVERRDAEAAEEDRGIQLHPNPVGAEERRRVTGGRERHAARAGPKGPEVVVEAVDREVDPRRLKRRDEPLGDEAPRRPCVEQQREQYRQPQRGRQCNNQTSSGHTSRHPFILAEAAGNPHPVLQCLVGPRL